MSKRFRLNWYDMYSGARDIALLVISFCVANIDIIKTLLERYGVSKTIASGIIWFILEMGRRFIREYKK